MCTEHSDRIGHISADLRRLREATQLPLDDLLAESRAFYQGVLRPRDASVRDKLQARQALDHSNIAARSRRLS